MYIDNTITTEFTGYYDSEDEVYVYPSARQNLLLLNVIGADATTTTSTTTEDEEIPEEDDTPTPPSAYLSAMDGDFSTDGATFTHSAGESEDITIGNAISQVMSGTLLNPDGLLDGLAFSKNVKAFIGVETATEAATIPEGASAYVEFAPLGGTVYSHYAIGSVAYADGDAIRDMGEEITSISALPYLAGHIYFWTASGACLYFDETEGYVPPAGSTYTYATDPRWHYVADISTTGWGDFMQGKYANTQQSLLMDGTRKYFVAGSKPTIYTWDVENGTKTTWQYVPMGIFDMSAVSVSGFAYTFEAYDRMIAFDADATDWVQSLDFTNPKTVSGLVGELMTEMGFSYTIPASAVNTALTISKNPITDYSVSYRQILAWLAETMGCNVRMSRTGSVEFYTYSASPVMTITPDVIASQTREVSRYTIPQITRVVCYNTLGAAYTSGTAGQDYTILGNPFLDPSASTACIDNLLTLLSAVPAFNTTSFTDACADPRIDAGDFLTIERTDGTSYVSPVMHQTLTWRGMCVADYESTGNQTREVPSSEAMSAFEGTVNSNPSAVIAKIEAEGISADWITSGKLTVLDSNDNVLFEADKEQNAVQIAGFTVSDTSMSASQIVEDPDGDQEKRVDLTIDGVKTSWSYMEGTSTGTAPMTANSDLAQGSLTLQTELEDSREGYSSKTVINGSSFIAEDQDNLSNYIRTDVYGGQVSLEMQAFPSGGVIGDDEKTIRFSPSKTLPEISVSGSSQEALITPDKITLGNPAANGAVTIQRAAATSADPYNLKFETVSSRYMAQHGTQCSRMYDSGTSGTAPATSGSVNNTTRNPNGYYASDNTSFSAATKGSAMTREDGFVAKDGSEVVSHDSNGLSWEHGTGATSSMRMFTLTHSSSSTAETTYTIDLPFGVYLFLHSRYTLPTAASTGTQFVTIGQTVGSSAVIKTSADSGSQIGATSGTRSQVEISNTRQGSTSDTQDRLATVTWTVQGLSYRRLVMVRLM